MHDTKATIAEVKELHARAQRPNLLIKIPGTREGLPAIEEAIFAGIPVNVTLLFSDDQYIAAADAFMRGVERRIAAGLSPDGRDAGAAPSGRGRRVTRRHPWCVGNEVWRLTSKLARVLDENHSVGCLGDFREQRIDERGLAGPNKRVIPNSSKYCCK